MYFALVSALFSVPFHLALRHGFGLIKMLRKSKPLSFALFFGAMAAGVVSVHFFSGVVLLKRLRRYSFVIFQGGNGLRNESENSFAHPYLLADNRHYTFYIWRKVINGHWSMRYLLVPVYVYSWLSILGILGKIKSKIWVLAYFLACVAVLVPTPLVEFRYYTIPFFIFMLNCGIEETRKWLLIGILYIAINVFTLCMFLYRPFYWTHEAGVQRPLWTMNELIKRMPMRPGAALLGSLLSASRTFSDVQLAEYAAKELINLEPWNSEELQDPIADTPFDVPATKPVIDATFVKAVAKELFKLQSQEAYQVQWEISLQDMRPMPLPPLLPC
ncbi:hypothetical protein KSS87_015094 [Heliosperma pusillum]|nr:hypothetical protein KSS87_015094 [Heliosperma pusillum]